MSLSVLAFLVSIGTIAGLVKLTTSAIEGDAAESTEESSALTVDVSSTELTIELADDPVFAVLPVDITVEEATALGYTLTAYTEDTNLVSTTDSSKVIPMVTVDTTDIEEANEAEELRSLESDAVESSDSSSLVPLSPNTYGLSFTDPESALDEVFTSLSTDSTTPTFITDKDYEATLENDTTTIYYGFYITPDTPYGTYTGSNITVDAISNIATVTYNANGLYFNDSEEATENTVGYKPNIAESPIEEVVGEYLTPAPLTPADPSTTIHYTFLGWSETEGATTPDYTSEEDILANLTLTKNESLTLYAVWHYNTVLSFNGTTSDGGEAIEQQTIAAGTTITLPHNTYTRTGSVFTGWNTEPDGTGTSYPDQGTYTAPMTPATTLNLYAQWVVPPTDLTFTAGEHIDTLMVADSSQNWKPFYVTPTNVDRSIVFTTPAEDTKYIITVVPEAGYVLSSDSADSSYEVAFSTGTLASNTLLTTAFTSGSAGNIITVSAVQAGSDSAHPAYTTMQSLTAAQCPAYTDSAHGINVTDSRDNKSYTVAKFSNYCYMLSNLRLDGSTELTTDTSHVSSAYTLPVDTGSGGWTDDYCKPYMASTNGEYYYNWPAATARANSTSSTSGCYNDTSNSKGDICPAGWSLPTYNDITPDTLWNSGTNPGMLSTAGYFNYDSQYGVGNYGDWWSSTRLDNYSAYHLYFTGTNASRYGYHLNKYYGYSVRCMRSS